MQNKRDFLFKHVMHKTKCPLEIETPVRKWRTKIFFLVLISWLLRLFCYSSADFLHHLRSGYHRFSTAFATHLATHLNTQDDPSISSHRYEYPFKLNVLAMFRPSKVWITNPIVLYRAGELLLTLTQESLASQIRLSYTRLVNTLLMLTQVYLGS